MESLQSDVVGCLACDLAAGRVELPGGVVAETEHWLVEHMSHFVVQPVTRALVDETGLHGPALQLSLFEAGEPPPPDDVAAFAERARALFRG